MDVASDTTLFAQKYKACCILSECNTAALGSCTPALVTSPAAAPYFACYPRFEVWKSFNNTFSLMASCQSSLHQVLHSPLKELPGSQALLENGHLPLYSPSPSESSFSPLQPLHLFPPDLPELQLLTLLRQSSAAPAASVTYIVAVYISKHLWSLYCSLSFSSWIHDSNLFHCVSASYYLKNASMLKWMFLLSFTRTNFCGIHDNTYLSLITIYLFFKHCSCICIYIFIYLSVSKSVMELYHHPVLCSGPAAGSDTRWFTTRWICLPEGLRFTETESRLNASTTLPLCRFSTCSVWKLSNIEISIQMRIECFWVGVSLQNQNALASYSFHCLRVFSWWLHRKIVPVVAQCRGKQTDRYLFLFRGRHQHICKQPEHRDRVCKDVIN